MVGRATTEQDPQNMCSYPFIAREPPPIAPTTRRYADPQASRPRPDIDTRAMAVPVDAFRPQDPADDADRARLQTDVHDPDMEQRAGGSRLQAAQSPFSRLPPEIEA